MSRSLMFLLSAVCLLAGAPCARAEGPASESQKAARLAHFGFVNGVVGSGRLDVHLDGKRAWRRVRSYGSSPLQRPVDGEGYTIDILDSRTKMHIADSFTTDIVAGRSYTLVASGDVDSAGPVVPILVDHPRQAIPRRKSHVALVNATTDASTLTLEISRQVIHESVQPGQYTDYSVLPSGWGRVELYSDGELVYGPKYHWFFSGRTALFNVVGTAQKFDGHPLRIVVTRPK